MATIRSSTPAAIVRLSARGRVIAGSPTANRVTADSTARLIRIDTGNSRYYNGQPTWLEINGGQLTPHNVTRSVR